VLYSKDWDSGILGIVSSKVANEYNRPTILLSEVGDELKGSARSVNDIDIFSAISSLKTDVLEAFGGHKMAAGLTIKKKNFKSFLASLNDYLSKNYSPKDFLPSNLFDMTLEVDNISQKLVDDLEIFEPCGLKNPKPIFNVLLSNKASFSTLKKFPNHLSILEKGLNIVAFNSYKYLPLLKSSNTRHVQIELQKSNFGGKSVVKGIAKNIYTGSIDKLSSNDYCFGEYLKQICCPECKCYKKAFFYKKEMLGNLIKSAKDECFGTLFVCFSLESYKELLVATEGKIDIQHYMYEVISNSGINAVVLAPTSTENFGAYKKIVFMDAILSKNYINSISKSSQAKIFVPSYKKVDQSVFRGLSLDRNVFGKYFKIISNFASTQESFFGDIDFFKKLCKNNRTISFKQFIFCLYVFLELKIFEFGDEYSIKENKKVVSSLDKSKFYQEVGLVLQSIEDKK